ncbi:hypothetical protein H1C71_012370, partial [Ictidomys tridecemlineatus]
TCSEGSQLPCSRDTQTAIWGDACGEIRSPANSPVSEASQKLILRPKFQFSDDSSPGLHLHRNRTRPGDSTRQPHHPQILELQNPRDNKRLLLRASKIWEATVKQQQMTNARSNQSSDHGVLRPATGHTRSCTQPHASESSATGHGVGPGPRGLVSGADRSILSGANDPPATAQQKLAHGP